MAQLKFLDVLTDDELYQIHVTALRILKQIGVRMREEEARKILKEAGCKVDGERVYIPSWVVENALATVPPSFTLYGRDRRNQYVVDNRNVHYQPMIGRKNFLEYPSMEWRPTTLQDVKNLVKVADALELYDILHSGAIMPHIEGVPDEVAHVHGYLASVTNSSKVLKASCRGRKVAKDSVEMAAIVAGGKEELEKYPCAHTTYNIISPLDYDRVMTEGLIEFVRAGIPVDIASEPQMGATSPVSLAGTLAQQTAEHLAGVVLTQAIKPGAPVMIGTVAAAMDMRNGTIALGGVEAALINAAHAQIGRFYSIPTRGTGCNTEAKILDTQAGFEKCLTLLIPAMAGVNLIFYPGTLDHALTISLESLVIDHEICRLAERVRQGITVDRGTLAEQVISSVGPGGEYLTAKHTFQYFEQEHFVPQMLNRDTRTRWVSAGSKDSWQSAHERVQQILKEHEPAPMPEDTLKELEDYVKFVEKRELNQ